jgi:hypothetical protein
MVELIASLAVCLESESTVSSKAEPQWLEVDTIYSSIRNP